MLTLVASPATAEQIAVIVNLANNTSSLSKSGINQLYRGLSENWRSGEKVIGVNYPMDHSVRAAFYRQVLDAEASTEFYIAGSPTPFRTSTHTQKRFDRLQSR